MSGNSYDRRRRSRAKIRQWHSEKGRFAEGEEVKLTSNQYGSRYKGTKVHVMSKAQEPDHWIVLSHRRKSPMTVADEHLEQRAKAA